MLFYYAVIEITKVRY